MTSPSSIIAKRLSWPWSLSVAILAVQAGLWFFERYLTLGKGMAVLYALASAAIAIAVILACSLVGFFLSGQIRFISRSLSAMVPVVIIPCCWFATEIAHSARQREAVEGLREVGCQVEHEPIVEGDTAWGPSKRTQRKAVRLSQSPMVRFLGPSFFADVVCADNDGTSINMIHNADMDCFRALDHLRELNLDLHGDLAEAFGFDGSEEIVDDDGMNNLKGLVRLRRLILSNGPNITDASLASFKGMSQLQELRLYDMPQITDAGLANLQHLRTLQVVDIPGACITGAGLGSLKRLTCLRELSLDGNPLTDVGMEHIARLGSLEALSLRETRLTNAGLRKIGRLGRLRVLSLDDTEIGDEGLKHLSQLRNLRILSLSATEVTDAGLKQLASLRQLEQLDLGGTKVSDVGLRHLETLTNLQVLVLDNTEASDSGRNHLRSLKHFAELDFDGPVMWLSSIHGKTGKDIFD